MKKLYFIALLILIYQKSFYIAADDLFSKYSQLTLYADNNQTFAVNALIPFGEFRFSLQDENQNFGITATSSKITKSIPFSIKAGNLSPGGILSKMNNPMISASASPFSSGISDINPITAALPGTTSFSKPVSTFCEISFLQKNSIFQSIKINGLYIPESQISVFSLYNKFSLFRNKLKLEFSGCTGIFPYDENNISSWFTKDLYYHQGNHFCSFFQISASCQNLSTIFSTGLYESPFGILSPLYRLDNKITTKRFIFNISALYNPNIREEKIITSSDKTLNDCFQFRIGVQYKFVTGINNPLFIKTGFQTYSDLRLSQTEYPLKIAAGLQISSTLFSLSLTSNLNTKINSESKNYQTISFESVNFQLKNSWYIRSIIPSITLTAGINPNNDFSVITRNYKIGTSFSHTKLPKITSSGSFSLTQKNEDFTSKKISGTISTKFNWKKLYVIIKISGDLEL